MTEFAQAEARGRWRIRAVFDAAFGAWETASTYTLTRADGARTECTVTRAFSIDVCAVDLVLSEALLEGVIYVVTAAGVTGSASVGVARTIRQEDARIEVGDPEAEAFGVDIDWLATSLDANGDSPEVRGLPCLRHDLVAIANTGPTELYHRPGRGAGLRDRVNGPSANVGAACRTEWLRDPRVRTVANTETVNNDGERYVRSDITPIALDSAFEVRSDG
jgi:hypothetical protein